MVPRNDNTIDTVKHQLLKTAAAGGAASLEREEDRLARNEKGVIWSTRLKTVVEGFEKRLVQLGEGWLFSPE